MWFYWYWYEHVIIFLATAGLLYHIKYNVLKGEDILLSIIKYFKEKND